MNVRRPMGVRGLYSAAMFSGRLLLTLTLALGSFSCGGASSEKPNLLFVVLDTTRADHLGCFGYERRDTSPTLDALAARGVLFRSVYSQSSLTPVSAGSFLTGTWPYEHGIRSLFVVGKESLASQSPSLFETFRTAGWQTAGFVSAKPMDRQYGLDRGFETFEDDMQSTKAEYRIGRFEDAPQRPGDVTVDLALDWLDDHGQDPFALFVHVFDAHDPSFVPPREFLEQHVSFPLPPNLGRQWSYGAFQGPQGLDMERLLELYDAEIRFTDELVGRLLTKLEDAGVLDDTVVCLIADHGESFGEHGYFTHGWMAEEQIRIPLILAGPGLPSGAVQDARIRAIDVAPTLCELFDLNAPAGFSGRSALGLARGEQETSQREVYAEAHHAPNDYRGRAEAMHTLIDGDWKLVHYPGPQADELFDLSADPGETRNLAESEPQTAARLLGKLIDRRAIGGGEVDLSGLDEDQLQKLRELGYLGED